MDPKRAVIRLTLRDLEGYPELLHAVWNNVFDAIYVVDLHGRGAVRMAHVLAGLARWRGTRWAPRGDAAWAEGGKLDPRLFPLDEAEVSFGRRQPLAVPIVGPGHATSDPRV